MTTKRRTTRKPESNGHFQDGTITIDVQGGPYDGQTIHMDASVLQDVGRRLIQEHELPLEDGKYNPTPEFMIAFDARLKDLGYTSTPTIAIHAWVKALDWWSDVQKKTKRSRSSRTGTEST